VKPFDLEIERHEDYAVLRPNGDLDLASVDDLYRALKPLEDEFKEIVVDLGMVEFLDSAGLRAIVSAHGRARHNGLELRVIKGSDQVQSLLARMDERLPPIDHGELPPAG
jgi:anti-sigma B factor antagonist